MNLCNFHQQKYSHFLFSLLCYFFLTVQPVFALSCGEPYVIIIGDCNYDKCSRAFKVIVDIGDGCQGEYTLTKATPDDLVTLSDSVLFWANYNKNIEGLFEYSNADWGTIKIKKLDFVSLEEAGLFWERKVLYATLVDIFWTVLDICILLLFSIILPFTIRDFKKKYILKQENICCPFCPQIMMFIISIVPAFYLVALYIPYWSAIFFVIIPLVLVFEILSIIIYWVSNKINN